MGVITWNKWFNFTGANMTILLFNTWEREQDVTEQFKWGLSPYRVKTSLYKGYHHKEYHAACTCWETPASLHRPTVKRTQKKNNIIDAIKKYILRWDKCEFHHSSTYKKSPEIHAFSSVRPNSGKPRSKASIRVGLIIEPIQFNVF